MLAIETSNSLETTVDVQEGMEIDRGYISPQFVNNGAWEGTAVPSWPVAYLCSAPCLWPLSSPPLLTTEHLALVPAPQPSACWWSMRTRWCW